jgi:SAM-dependent methyltransferase
MTDDRTVWEEAYQRRGQRWSGAVPPLPALPRHARVLELGCGNGKTFLALLQKGWDTVALDFSGTAVKTARSHILPEHYGEGILADARNIPFCPASFDAIFAWHILGHMTGPDRIHIAREMSSLLRPGGLVLFSEFSREDFRYNQGTLLEEGTFLRGTAISTHYFTEDETRSLFPDLTCTSLWIHRWDLRVRGQDHARSEIQAVFTNTAGR